MRELAQHIMDLVENSARAGARRIEIDLEERHQDGLLVLRVRDDGTGMSPETVERATDPFYTTRTCRRVGLGLPLLAASAARCGGSLRIESTVGTGTTVEVVFQLHHIDTPPVGDLKSSIMCAMVGHPDSDIRFRRIADGRRAEVDSGEIKAELGTVPLTYPSVLRWLEQVVAEAVDATMPVAAHEEKTNA